MQIKNNPNYYETLKNNNQPYPTCSFNQIELDLRRTYPYLKEQDELEEKIKPLRNVLVTFVKRNCLIGYQQGMNFLADRLLDIF